jgi:hypothetical protein
MKRVVAAVLAGSVLSCAPLTFSHEGAIDFERYRVALVQEVPTDAFSGGDWADYLARELHGTSGFELVTTDASVEVDLVIVVSTFVVPEVTCECEDYCDVECYSDCVCETEFDATASYVATTPAGAVIDEGTESDTSSTWDEAVEDALDEVALHYMRPYRL